MSQVQWRAVVVEDDANRVEALRRVLDEEGAPTLELIVVEEAAAARRVLEGEGFGRADFLLEESTGDFYLNELNSLPGFTDGSMFPRLWEATGLPYAALLDRLIELAVERHQERSKLETVFRGDGKPRLSE